jgi:hypothetical protein
MLQEHCDNGGVAATKQSALNLQEARKRALSNDSAAAGSRSIDNKIDNDNNNNNNKRSKGQTAA